MRCAKRGAGLHLSLWRDPSRAAAAFGFKATTDFRAGLTQTIDWYHGHREEAEARDR